MAQRAQGQMLQMAASDYWMLISSGLFLAIQIRKNSHSNCIILNKTPQICPYNWTMIDVRCVTITCLTEVLVKSRVAIMASLIEKVCVYVCVHISVIIHQSSPGLVPYTPFFLKL